MIALTVIVKNEVKDLDRCLKSAYGKVDAIYVAITNTGKRLALEEIIAKYDGKAFLHEWKDDYAEARNFIMSQVPKDYEYVMYLDADDTLEGDIDEPTTDAIYVPYHVGDLEFSTIRIVKNNGSWRWKGRVHELLTCDTTFTSSKSGFYVQHHEKFKPSRDSWNTKLEILTDEYSQSARTAYYYARETATEGKIDEAIHAYQAYLMLPGWTEERYVANHALADLYRAKNDYTKAIEQDLQGLLILPDARDSYFGIAEGYYYMNDWEKLIMWTELGLTRPLRNWTMIHDVREETFNYLIFYVVALDKVGRKEEAFEYTKKAIEIDPKHEQHVQNLAFYMNTFSVQ